MASSNELATNAYECAICAEKYNNSTLKPVPCEYGDCNFVACKACVRTYLLNTTNDPHCMDCKKGWTEQFIVSHLNRSFIISDYKQHRRTLLLDREISKLPETMHVAERHKRVDQQKQIIHEINEQLKENRRVYNELFAQSQLAYSQLNVIKTGKETVDSERKKFIMPCPNNDCRGYLSTQYKCELCTLYTCVHCHDIIGYKKDDPHTCIEANIQSAELIKKETKPCPTCGIRISKISGCDQMWCTECHKAFSWSTGLVDNGVIHNPHFYQYQREQAGGDAPPRNPGDIVCGGLCHYADLNSCILAKIQYGARLPDTDYDLREHVGNIHRFINHILNVDLNATRTRVRVLSDFEEVRCNYILQRISKEDMAKTIYRNDALRKKLTEMLHLYELISVVGVEMFAKLIASKLRGSEFTSFLIQHINEYNTLRIYCNKQFKTISITYNQTVPFMNKNWTVSKKKYTIVKKTAIKAGQGQAQAQADEDGQGQIDELAQADEDTEDQLIA